MLHFSFLKRNKWGQAICDLSCLIAMTLEEIDLASSCSSLLKTFLELSASDPTLLENGAHEGNEGDEGDEGDEGHEGNESHEEHEGDEESR